MAINTFFLFSLMKNECNWHRQKVKLYYEATKNGIILKIRSMIIHDEKATWSTIRIVNPSIFKINI